MGLACVQLGVLIDTYNHEKLIAKAINSVLEQDYPDSHRQVIVVNDGSTDHTATPRKLCEASHRRCG